MSEWKEIALSETTKFIVDNRGKTVPTIDERTGIPLIKTNCISNNYLYPTIDGVHFISEETYNNWFRAHPIPKDIIITLKGSQNGAVCLVPNPVNFVIAQDMVALRVDEEVIDPLYLFAALRSREVQHQIKTLDVSGVIPHLKKTDFDKLILPFPDKTTQKEIGQTYFKLSSKIELLQRQNQTLEQLAQTLFKRWFVEFEFPNENGKPYRSSGGKMISSELGEIPEGWRVGSLGEITTLKSGYAFKSSDFVDHSETKALKIKDLKGAGRVSLSEVSSISNEVTQLERVQYFKLGAGDIVLAMSGNTTGKIGVVPPHENELYLNQRVGKFFKKDDKLNSYLYFFLMSGGFEEKILSMGYGSAQPNISPSQIENIELSFATDELIKDYSKISNPIFEKVLENNKEIQTLTKLRDTLLPKLMNGELKVKQETINHV